MPCRYIDSFVQHIRSIKKVMEGSIARKTVIVAIYKSNYYSDFVRILKRFFFLFFPHFSKRVERTARLSILAAITSMCSNVEKSRRTFDLMIMQNQIFIYVSVFRQAFTFLFCLIMYIFPYATPSVLISLLS